MKELQSVNNVINGVATIQLYDQIGNTFNPDGTIVYGISGGDIARQIQYLNEVEKVERINIHINSIGGNVYEGYSIVSSILSSKAEVHTFIDGLAASIAGVIALCGKTCSMYDYGTLMLHNPSGKEASDDVLGYIKGTLIKIISNRSKRTQEEISFMMDGETWLSASEAYKMGFVDNIVSSAKEFKVEESNRRNLYNLVNIYNSLINEKTETMTNEEKAALESQLSDANAKIAALEAEKTTLAAKVAEFETEKETVLETQAVELVENAIKEGKISAESKDGFVKMAKIDFNTVKNSINSIVVPKVVKSANILEAAAKVDNKTADRSGWNIRTWEKKAPKDLENMYKNNRDEYDRLFDAYYKTKK